MKYVVRVVAIGLLLSAVHIAPTHAQFTDIQAGLTGVGNSAMDWADYDRDGDQDLIVIGTTGSTARTTLYRNDNGRFTAVNDMPFIHVSNGDVAWGDMDNDGDPDLLLTGAMNGGYATTQVYRNNGNGTFTDMNAGITAMQESMVAWGDFDNNGYLDFVIAGAQRNGQAATKFYYNRWGSGYFSDSGIYLQGLRLGDVAWVDYNNDNKLDLMLTGRDTNNRRKTILYRQENGTLKDSGVDYPDIDLSSIDWADYDKDGYEELLMSGTSNSGIITRIYENPMENNGAASIAARLEGVEFASVKWADTNQDERLDAVVMGRNAGVQTVTRIFTQTSDGIISDSRADLLGLFKGDLHLGFFDDDQKLDLAISGFTANDVPYTRIYTQKGGGSVDPNTPPVAPYDIYVVQDGNNMGFEWGYGEDKETPFFDLSYDIRVGTTPGGSEIIAPVESGPGMYDGIGQQVTLSSLAAGTYYWSVRSVDEGFARSAFATEQVFAIADDGFYNIGANLTGQAENVHWADVDGDGDQDAFLIGVRDRNLQPATEVFENKGGHFTKLDTKLPNPTESGSLQFVDIDNDNDLDVLFRHQRVSQKTSQAGVYRNDNGTFVNTGVDVSGSGCGSFTNQFMADFDNNGFVDLVNTAGSGLGIFNDIGVRFNTGGSFGDPVSWGNSGTSSGAAIADYNNDGRIDFFTGGLDRSACKGLVSELFQNTGDRFERVSSGELLGSSENAGWGDYDNDGDLDFMTTGSRFSALHPTGGTLIGLYRNDNGQLTLTEEILARGFGSVRWADYDMDGDLDVLLAGTLNSPLYENRGGTFVNITGAFDGIKVWHAEWADYDGDDDLDVIISGELNGESVTRIYSNSRGAKNDEPTAPSNLYTTVGDDAVTFHWSRASDEETPSRGLSYNLRVGTYPGGSDVLSATALADGTPLTSALGNVYQNTSWMLKGLGNGTYYWSVQSIDGGFMGSRFAAEQSFTKGGTPPPPPPPVAGVSFTDSGIHFTGVELAAAEWADFDKDGDLDVLVAGDTGTGPLTRLYRNDGHTFSSYGNFFTNVDRAAIDWGDYDNDGDQDVILIGRGNNWTFNTRLYRNTGNGFESINTGLPGLFSGDVEWGDYDNDGDLDILMSGEFSSYENRAGVYRNNGGSFEDIGARLTGTSWGQVSWVDYDSDGDLDILMTGRIDKQLTRRTLLYRNDHGTFHEVYDGLPDVDLGEIAWGDYDKDGDPDLLLTGTTGSEFITRIYRNTNGQFSDIGAGLPGVEFSAARWGDIDKDGDLDILLSGAVSGGRLTEIYENENGYFKAINASMIPVSKGAAAFGDYDGDGDLDVFVTGQRNGTDKVAVLYKNTPAPSSYSKAAVFDQEADLQIAGSEVPQVLQLLPNYPNPFNPTTQIQYELHEAMELKLAVYDVTGKLVDLLVDGYQQAGRYEVQFDGNGLASGVYLSRLETPTQVLVKRMILLK